MLAMFLTTSLMWITCDYCPLQMCILDNIMFKMCKSTIDNVS